MNKGLPKGPIDPFGLDSVANYFSVSSLDRPLVILQKKRTNVREFTLSCTLDQVDSVNC